MNVKQFFQNIKWSYVLITLLFFIIVFMYFNKSSCYQNSANKQVETSEGYRPIIETVENIKNNDIVQQDTHVSEPPRDGSVDNSVGEIILYYATWCGYSKMFLPIWEKFEEHAAKNMPRLIVRKLRCEGGDERTCVEKGVEGYPTVILYPRNNTEVVFQKDRTLEELIEFVHENVQI